MNFQYKNTDQLNNLKAMTTTETTPRTNDLRYTTEKCVNDVVIIIKIRLNDKCKNGHQDFAITGDIYKAGLPRTDRNWLSGGCVHDEILKYFPEFKNFVALHLCDYTGVPMHGIENGFYHLQNGFNNTKPNSAEFKTEFCEYYRLTAEQFEAVATSQNKVQYYLNLQKTGVFEQWQKQANEAIQQLEKLTGEQFIVDSKRTQLTHPTESEIKEELQRQKSGFYTPEAIAKREADQLTARLEKLQDEMLTNKAKEIEKIEIEYQVKRQVLLTGGEKALNNCIFYNHTKQLAFNWKGYDHISDELIAKITKGAILPEGVTIKKKE